MVCVLARRVHDLLSDHSLDAGRVSNSADNRAQPDRHQLCRSCVLALLCGVRFIAVALGKGSDPVIVRTGVRSLRCCLGVRPPAKVWRRTSAQLDQISHRTNRRRIATTEERVSFSRFGSALVRMVASGAAFAVLYW